MSIKLKALCYLIVFEALFLLLLTTYPISPSATPPLVPSIAAQFSPQWLNSDGALSKTLPESLRAQLPASPITRIEFTPRGREPINLYQAPHLNAKTGLGAGAVPSSGFDSGSGAIYSSSAMSGADIAAPWLYQEDIAGLGRLIISYHQAAFAPLPARQALVLFISQLAFIVLATVLIYLVIHRRKRKIIHAINTLSRFGVGPQMNIANADEFSDIELAINRMSKSLQIDQEMLQENLEKQKDSYRTISDEKIKQRAILDASLDAIISINEKQQVVEYNKVAEEIFGYTKEEVLNQPMMDLILPPHYREPHKAGIERFMSSGKSVVIGQRLSLCALRKNGETFPIEICISSLNTDNGYLFIANIRDITERDKVDTELKLAAHAFASSDAMFICDLSYKVIRCNNAFTRMTGFSEAQVFNQHLRHLAAKGTDKIVYRSIWIKLWEKLRWEGEVLVKRQDGSNFPALVTISAVQGAKYKTTHYVAHFIDISKQKQSEAILQQAKIDAERASVSKSRFLASMSHEIRTPINGVLGLLTMLEDSQLNAAQQNIVNTAKASGKMLLSIINDVLDFSKMESGNLSLVAQPFDIRDTFKQTLELLLPIANRKGIALRFNLDNTLPPWVEGDADRLAQVLMNITNNAIKFTHKGYVNVELSYRPLGANSIEAMCKITDTGIGIAEDLLPNLFNEFTMADQSFARSKEGTGLGLAISARLINLMHGEIHVESELNHGSCFSFSLPLLLGFAPSHYQAVTQANGSENTLEASNLINDINSDPSLKPLILVVEDNLANCMVVQHQLAKANYDFMIANNGFKAIELLKDLMTQGERSELSRLPAAILMDISMPEMDGMETTRIIRAMPAPFGQLPIIALTAHALSGDKERFIAAGMDDYLSKPTNRKLLEQHIQVFIQRSGASSETPDISHDSQSDALIDEKVINQLISDIDAQDMPEILTLYLQDTRQRLQQFTEALQQNDIARLEFEGHTIGSSAAAHGNASLCRIMRSVEALCQQDDIVGAKLQAEQAILIATRSFIAVEIRIKRGFIAAAG
ncbi:PAS domain S-box protein [Shewanella sp. SNU WT4]|uniref:PAS domain S-box protein n=1 Tax=Shewanella sp. SNU WT4 TaxID=2590015 RepID=UPI001127AAAC|nr:PAS domain S-box protein [Shewanella sp. SNU WT4]QDF68134.1 PAS domain S-box protein [Shewanella sp. SNU WT4]